MDGVDTGTGWYFRKREDSTGGRGGPYSWADLVSYAQQGLLAPDDLVWHASLPDWMPASGVQGLFASSSPVGAGAPSAPPPRRSGRIAIVTGVVLAGLLLIGLAGGSAWWFFGRSGPTASGPDLGVAEVVVPDAASLIQTTQWGEVPANQIGVVLAEEAKRKDAERLAEDLGGSVVGEIEYLSLYQIEFPGTTEADLVAALAKAEAAEKVALAFPNQQDTIDAEIWGVRQDPYNDPVYGGGAGDGYSAIGVTKAWNYIKGAGIDLKNVKVGIVDDGLYKSGEGRESEFGGDVEIEYPDAAAGELAAPEVWDDGTTNPAGSHGTGVSTIIGADPGNGGPSGVAGPLGKKLKISMINKYTGQYGSTTTTTPDPNDPTKATIGTKTYSFGTLVALKKQVENNAKVINCSFGKTDGHPAVAAAYKKFFEKMAADHPDVIFVCSAGNDGVEVDGSKRFPSGHALSNMITVGAVDNEGKLASFSNKKTGNYEVTLAAPGQQAVVGIKPEGGPEQQDGTSFAAPHVSAAAAVLKAIDPSLQAGDIKRLLVDSARTSLTKGDVTVNAPAETGGRILALDRAVFTLINTMRKAQGLAELTEEDMENLGVVDAVAITGAPGEYDVKGIVKAVGEKGAELSIAVTGENHAIGGKTTQSLPAAGEVKWGVTLPKDEGVITVRRGESGASSMITIERFDINGMWSGSFTITDIEITDQEAAEEEGCSLALLSQLKGKAMPMTMDIAVDESGQGSGQGLIDIASVMGEGDSEPQTYGVALTGNTIEYTVQDGGGAYAMSATVKREGDTLVQNGTLSASGPGFKMKAVFTLTKPEAQ